MPTIKEVLNRVKIPGTISDSIKVRWLGELDKIKYRYPEDADTELKYSFAIYEKYLIAMNDFFSGDMTAYEESATQFYITFAERGVINERNKT